MENTMTFKQWTSATTSFTNAVSGAIRPRLLPGETLPIGSGTVTLRNTRLDGISIRLAGTQADTPVLDIAHVVLGRHATLLTENFAGDATQFVFAGTLRAHGWNVNLGTIKATSGDFQRAAQLDIDIVADGRPGGAAPTFVNAGTIAGNPMADINVHAGTPGATLLNRGLISVAGHATLGADVAGTGTIRLEAAIPLHGFTATPDLTIAAGIGAGQTIEFIGGNVLRINDLADFDALISGFSASLTAGALDRIELTGRDITGSTWEGTESGGTLTLLEGATVAGEIRFAGSFAADPFTLTHLDLVTPTGPMHTTWMTATPV